MADAMAAMLRMIEPNALHVRMDHRQPLAIVLLNSFSLTPHPHVKVSVNYLHSLFSRLHYLHWSRID